MFICVLLLSTEKSFAEIKRQNFPLSSLLAILRICWQILLECGQFYTICFMSELTESSQCDLVAKCCQKEVTTLECKVLLWVAVALYKTLNCSV